VQIKFGTEISMNKVHYLNINSKTIHRQLYASDKSATSRPIAAEKIWECKWP